MYHNTGFNSISKKEIGAEYIAKSLGGHRSGTGYMAPCPGHKDSSPSLSLKDTICGRVLLHCFGGCPQQKVIAELRKLGLWPNPHWNSAYRTVTSESQSPDKSRNATLHRVWTESKPIITGDKADKYLRGRGISLDKFPEVLRCHPKLGYWEFNKRENNYVCTGHFPAMVARVDSPSGNLISIHRTYLASDGNGKAPVPSQKKLMSPELPGETKGAAIRLFEAGEVLAVAEGIETALAVHIQSGLPCWATVSASGMEAIKIPDCVQMVIICADRDKSEAGEQAAKALARRLLGGGQRCKILIPDIVGADWADPLEAHHG
jgi:putative DNA primase/helicase